MGSCKKRSNGLTVPHEIKERIMGVSIAGYASTSDTLLNFRTAYLRLIANAWGFSDGVKTGGDGVGKFLEQFFGGSTDRQGVLTTGNILDKEEFCKLLPGAKYSNNNSLPWSAHVKVRYDKKNGPQWEPGITAGWSGPNDKFEILLPPAPKDTNQFDVALAAYFQQFPTLLGHNKESTTEIDGSAADFVEFGNVIMQAIAQSWSKEKINGTINRKEGKYTFRDLLIANGIETLSRFYGYNNPWNFDIKFKKAEDEMTLKPSWDSRKQEWKGGALYNVIILNMPNKPEAQKNARMGDVIRPVALATYNANGAHYPFTCP